jgi:sulfhydrogenase subunit beta (sulfur reductase)
MVMKSGKITKNDLIQWLKIHQKNFLVTERVAHHQPELLCDQSKEIKNIKEALFLPWDKLFNYHWENQKWNVENIQPSASPRFLMALPCETRAIYEVLDRVFLQPSETESGYAARRQGLKMVIVGCVNPEPTCFCNLVGGNPYWSHPDALFILPFHDEYYLETNLPEQFDIMEKGTTLNKAEKEEIEVLRKQMEEKANQEKLPEDVPQGLYDLFEDQEWEDLSWKCLNCGACTFLCPTCQCFDMSAEGRLKGFQLKTWDSCMFPKFTLHASGHNPRPTFKERVRQRVLHKFSYFPLREEGLYGCVGCGKCIEICPVNWNIREAVERMVKKIGNRS